MTPSLKVKKRIPSLKVKKIIPSLCKRRVSFGVGGSNAAFHWSPLRWPGVAIETLFPFLQKTDANADWALPQ